MKFQIFGNIVDSVADKTSPEDVCPADIKKFIDELGENEPIELTITSFGGSCTAGNAIVGMLRKASSEGHATSAHVVAIAASMASVIACACEKLTIDSNAFLMIHLPYSCIEGNYINLRKEANTLEMVARSLVSVYRTKFDLDDSKIMQMLEDETWVLGSDAEQYGLKCKILKVDEPLKIAASLKKCKYVYKNIPKGFTMEEKEEKTEESTKQVEILKEPTVEEIVKKELVEEAVEDNKEDIIELLKKRILELEAKLAQYENEAKEVEKTDTTDTTDNVENMVSKEECEKRVSGMQAKMQRKINDFVNQLKVRDEELAKAKAEAISLQNELEKSSNELSKMTSALVEKENALAMLNASVNACPVETKPSGWGKLEGEDFFNYLKKNNGILTIRNK